MIGFGFSGIYVCSCPEKHINEDMAYIGGIWVGTRYQEPRA